MEEVILRKLTILNNFKARLDLLLSLPESYLETFLPKLMWHIRLFLEDKEEKIALELAELGEKVNQEKLNNSLFSLRFLLYNAEAKLRLGKKKQALRKLFQANILVPQLRETLQGEFFIEIGALFQEGKWLDFAFDAFQKANKIYAILGDKVNQAVAVTNMGVNSCERNCFEEAKQYFKQALSLTEEAEYKPVIINSFLGLGYCFDAQENFTKAIYNYKKALPYALTQNDRLKISNVLYNIAYANKLLGNYRESFQNYIQSLKLARELEYKLAWAEFFYYKGKTLASCKAHQLAINCFEQALNLYKEIGSNPKIKKIKNEFVHLYKYSVSPQISSVKDAYQKIPPFLYLCKPEVSILPYKETLKTSKLLSSPPSSYPTFNRHILGNTLLSLGELALQENNLQLANEFFIEAITVSWMKAEERLIISALEGLGESYFKQKDKRKALAFYSEAALRSLQLNQEKHITFNYKEGWLYLYTHQFSKAYQYWLEYYSSLDKPLSPELNTYFTRIANIFSALGLENFASSFKAKI